MLRAHFAISPLRGLLVLAFALLLMFQTFSLPGQWAHMAEESPEHAYLRWPLTVFSVVELACIQVVIVCTWKLLAMVREDRIFSEPALRWVDGIVWAIAVGWVLFAGLFIYVGLSADDPGTPLLLFLLVVAGAVLGLLMVVLRALLRNATALRSDLEAVI
jgi:hypothetical protein